MPAPAAASLILPSMAIPRADSWHANSSALIAGIDYVNFASALSDSSGKLVITYSGNGSLEGDANGFQIQAVSGQTAVQTNNTAAYTWTTLAGHPPNGSADGQSGAIEFNQPGDVAMDSAGNVYVADSGNNTIRKITGQVSSTIAGVAGASGANTAWAAPRCLIFRRRWPWTERAIYSGSFQTTIRFAK